MAFIYNLIRTVVNPSDSDDPSSSPIVPTDPDGTLAEVVQELESPAAGEQVLPQQDLPAEEEGETDPLPHVPLRPDPSTVVYSEEEAEASRIARASLELPLMEAFTRKYSSLGAQLSLAAVSVSNRVGISKIIQRESVSVVNMLYPDMTYRRLGPFRDLTSAEHLRFFLGMLSKVVYESDERIRESISSWIPSHSIDGLDVLEVITSSHPTHDSTLMVTKFRHERRVFVTFRGTKAFSTTDWQTDFDFECCAPWVESESEVRELASCLAQNEEFECDYELLKRCEVHRGFFSALREKGEDGESLYDKVIAVLESIPSLPRSLRERNIDETPSYDLYICGHSMGGALAAIFTTCYLIYQPNLPFTLTNVTTFGAPKVGNESFISITLPYTTRVVCDLDIIPEVPEWLMHAGSDPNNNSKDYVLVTSILPIKFQRYARSKLPVVGFNMLDHLPGSYMTAMGKCYKFPNGPKSWEAFEARNGRSLQASDMMMVIEELEREVERLEERNLALEGIVLRQAEELTELREGRGEEVEEEEEVVVVVEEEEEVVERDIEVEGEDGEMIMN